MKPAQEPNFFDSNQIKSAPSADFSPWINLFERPIPPSPAELAWGAEQLERNDLSSADQERLDHLLSAYIASRSDLPAPNHIELEWAQQLADRHQHHNYQPNAEETARMRDISVRFVLAQQRQLEELLAALPAATHPPTASDLTWGRDYFLAVQAGEAPTHETFQRFLKILKACLSFGIKLSEA